MGAQHKLDLTSEVTHLIVGDLDTPKYKYVAQEREDVICVLPEWIEEVRDSWMKGGETDVEALEAEWKVPTFLGLRITLTGFEDPVERRKMVDAIERNGGQYSGDLNRDTTTHLIAHHPRGSKYEFSLKWGLPIVGIEWLNHSLQRGMILDEAKYNPVLKPADRGKGAWVRKALSTNLPTKRAREDNGRAEPARKLRRTASSRLSAVDGIWTDIVARKREDVLTEKEAWDEDTPLAHNDDHESSETIKQNDCSGIGPRALDSILPRPATKKGIFYSKRFFIYGFDDRRVSSRHMYLSQN